MNQSYADLYAKIKEHQRQVYETEYPEYKLFSECRDVVLGEPQNKCVTHRPTCRCDDCVNHYKNYEDVRMFLDIKNSGNSQPTQNIDVPDSVITTRYDIHGNVKPATYERHFLNDDQKRYIAQGLLTLDQVKASFMTRHNAKMYENEQRNKFNKRSNNNGSSNRNNGGGGSSNNNNRS